MSDIENLEPEEVAVDWADEDFVSPSVAEKPSQTDAPGEYIAHSIRLDKLTMKLISEATVINNAFAIPGDKHISFLPYPGGIKVYGWQMAEESIESGLTENFSMAIESVLASFDEANAKVYMHHLDYMAITGRNARDKQKAEAAYEIELAALKANHEKELRRLNNWDNGFQYCYRQNFNEYAYNLIMSRREPDGTWKKGRKSIATLQGSFALKAHSAKQVFNGKRITIADKPMLVSYLQDLASSADPEAKKLAKKLGIEVVKYTTTKVEYDLDTLKGLAEAEKLPGFLLEPVDPNGELVLTV